MTIFTPDDSEVAEIVLPDGSQASEVVAPDGSVVWTAAPDIPDSVTNQWPMNEGSGSTLTDEEGSRDLSVNGATWNAGYLDFDGSNDYASESNSDSYFSALDDFSFFGWYNADNLGDRHAWASVYDPNGDNRSWSFWYDGSNINLNTSTDGDNFQQASVSQSLATGSWHSIAVARDASTGDVEFYQDASSLGTASADTGTLFNSTEPFYVGARSDGIDWFDGLLHDFAFAKGTVMPQSDIQALHDNTGP